MRDDHSLVNWNTDPFGDPAGMPVTDAMASDLGHNVIAHGICAHEEAPRGTDLMTAHWVIPMCMLCGKLALFTRLTTDDEQARAPSPSHAGVEWELLPYSFIGVTRG